jgi:hypothetical protein
MYHWYVLLKKQLHSNLLYQEEKLVHKNNEWPHPFSSKMDSKLFWIGFFEFLPIAAGLIATSYFKPFLLLFDYVLIGVVMSILIAYFFRNDVPDQPIGNNNSTQRKIADVSFQSH